MSGAGSNGSVVADPMMVREIHEISAFVLFVNFVDHKEAWA